MQKTGAVRGLEGAQHAEQHPLQRPFGERAVAVEQRLQRLARIEFGDDEGRAFGLELAQCTRQARMHEP